MPLRRTRRPRSRSDRSLRSPLNDRPLGRTVGVPSSKRRRRDEMSIGLRILAAALLFWALARHAYSYYVLLRFVTFGAAAYSSYLAFEQRVRGWAWILGLVALLFNPVLPIHLSRDVWKPVDLLTGLILLASIVFVRDKAGVSPPQPHL